MTGEQRHEMNAIAIRWDFTGKDLEAFVLCGEVMVDFEGGWGKALALLDGAAVTRKARRNIFCALDELDFFVTELFHPGDEASADDIARYTSGDAS